MVCTEQSLAPLFRVVWMCLGIVLIAVLKVLQGPVLSSQQWGDELLLLPGCFPSLWGDSSIQGSSSCLLPGLALAQCVWMAKRGCGWSCSFHPWGTLSLTLFLTLPQSCLELCSFSPELCPRAGSLGSLLKKRWLGSCRSDVVMALVLRWFHQGSLEAWGFHCLLCLSGWNLWEKHWFGELFRITAPSLFYITCISVPQ